MQDFTKQVATSSDKANSVLLEQNNQIPILLSKDRLWNLVFWLGISSGLAAAHFTRTNLHMLNLAIFLYLLTFLGVPLLLIMFNKVCFIRDDTFTNSEGIEITKEQLPHSILLSTISGIAFSVLISIMFLPQDTNSLLVAFTYSVSIFSGLCLYFIFKNCPISILFNYKFWQLEFYYGTQGNGSKDYYSRVKNNSIFSGRPENIYINHKNR